MSIALDIGTQHLRSLRSEGGRLVGRKNHAVYLSLPDEPIQRRLLEKASIRYATCAGSLLVIGQAALETADMLQQPCVPLLLDSRVPQEDPVARQVLTSLIDCLLPLTSRAGEICWTTIPGAIDSDSNEKRFFSQLIRLKGYQPRIVPPGLGVVLAELGQSGFSGLGCDFGAGYTRTTFALRANEIASTCLAKGGDWIDASLAEAENCLLWDSDGNRYFNTTSMARWRAAQLISVFKPISEREQRLSQLCEEIISQTLKDLREQLAGDKTVATIRQSVPLVCSGGLSRLPGFCELLFHMVRNANLPIKVSEVRRCTDHDYTIARGCLILAELDETSELADVA